MAIHPRAGAGNAIDDVVAQTEEVVALGVERVWLAQQLAHDALTLGAVVAERVPTVEVGTSVVTIASRHPVTLAAQAKTVQASSGGRLTLGLGLGAPAIEGPTYGLPTDHAADRLRDHLTALRPLLDGEQPIHEGPYITARPVIGTAVAGSSRIPLLVAAMGPRALQVTGELADGTIPLFAGPAALESHIVPTISDAASAAGRPAPRVVAGVAVVVTSDVDRVRAAAETALGFYDTIPSYQRIVERSGVARAADLAVVGDEAHVRAELQRYLDAGATDLLITQTDLGGPDDQRRTWALVGSL